MVEQEEARKVRRVNKRDLGSPPPPPPIHVTLALSLCWAFAIRFTPLYHYLEVVICPYKMHYLFFSYPKGMGWMDEMSMMNKHMLAMAGFPFMQ